MNAIHLNYECGLQAECCGSDETKQHREVKTEVTMPCFAHLCTFVIVLVEL